MRCPHCNNMETKVLDSRPAEDGRVIRRRRECEKCGFRFSTYEELEILDLAVVKKDGTTESYARDKLQRAIKFPFDKRGFPPQTLKQVLYSIEQGIQTKAKDGKISSREIGEISMKEIKKVDKVAYIRFSAVYKQFVDIDDFKTAIEKI
jgi:transcriptional repressor NrdR